MTRDGDIDYRSYSRNELEEALENIDRVRYPKNHQNLTHELAAKPQTIREQHITESVNADPISTLNPVYAGFWRRLWALILDGLVLTPTLILWSFGYSHYHYFYLYWFVPGIAFDFFFHVYLVCRYGGTPGKIMSGLRIVTLDKASVGYQEAIIRYLPAALCNFAMTAGVICAEFSISGADWFSLEASNRSHRLGEFLPAWILPALGLWLVIDFIVMMANHKRRALHDFLAGTMVISNTPSHALGKQ